jgi:hypothetical protein
MHPKLQVKLNEKAAQYAKVTAFAKVLPMYADVIIENEYTGDMYHRLGQRYKELYFAWDIAWQVHKPTNFPDDRTYEEGTIYIYVNCMSIFNEAVYHMAQDKLREHMKDIPVYFYDCWNSSYYFKPHEIEVGLEALNNWYLDTKANVDAYLKEKRRKELQAELEKLEKQ